MSLYLIKHIMQLHMEVIQPHREVSSSPRNVNIRSKPLKWAMHPRDRWRRQRQIMAMCPSIAVSLSRSAAKSSTNGHFFSYKGSLPDRATPVPMVHLWQSMNVQATQAPGQVFLIITGKVFSSTHPLDLVVFFTEVRFILSCPTQEKKHQVSGKKSFECSVKILLWLSVLFHGLGNPAAHNVHGSQDRKALISHLLCAAAHLPFTTNGIWITSSLWCKKQLEVLKLKGAEAQGITLSLWFIIK